MSSRRQAPLPAPSPAPAEEPILTHLIGWISGWDPARGLLVDFEGNQRGPLPARSTIPLDAKNIQAAAAARIGAVLIFDRGDPGLPVVMGLIQPITATPLLDEVLGAAAATLPANPVEARIDGDSVVLEGKDEIVLKCGQASITLRRNGRVVIRGVQLETVASGIQRIKGGSVQIN